MFAKFDVIEKIKEEPLTIAADPIPCSGEYCRTVCIFHNLKCTKASVFQIKIQCYDTKLAFELMIVMIIMMVYEDDGA